MWEGVSNNADKGGQGDGGDTALSGHPFHCSLCHLIEYIFKGLNVYLKG